MSFLSVLKDIGAVIKWPFTHAQMIEELTADFKKDEPELQAVFVGLVSNVSSISSDTIAALASDGTNLPADLADLTALQAFFSYVKNTALPTIESVYTDFKTAVVGSEPASTVAAPAPPAAAPAVSAVPPSASASTGTVITAASAVAAVPAADPNAPQTGPGLHAVVKP